MLNQKKIVSLLCVLVLVLSMAGCVQASQEPAPAPGDKTEPRIVLLMQGALNDAGWNATAYAGLVEVEEKYGIDVKYREGIDQSEIEEVVYSYINEGYNFIIGHGSQFYDTITKVAPEYPDLTFVNTSVTVGQEPNVTAVNIDCFAQGFLAGCIAGMVTEKGAVAVIGGQESPPIIDSVNGFLAGAKYVNPDVKTLDTFTGSYVDSAKMKETAKAFINNGVDVLFANAGQSGLGCIESCSENGVLAIGSNTDQNEFAPDTVINSVIKDGKVMMTAVVEQYLQGTLKPEFMNLSVTEGAVYISPWHGFAEKLPKEVIEKVENIQKQMADGTIKMEDFK